MYLGWDESGRRQQLHALQAVLTGYRLALRQHGIGQRDLNVLQELEDFLGRRSGADDLTGIDQILATAASDQDAWNEVWALIEEFHAQNASDK